MISKLPNVGTTIFTVMSQMANKYNAINLSQGFPDFPIDERLQSILKKNATQDVHQYCPMSGLPSLRNEIAQKVDLHYGRKVDFETEILVTAGATQGLFTIFQAFIHPGDEAVVLDPAYDCYAPSIVLAGGNPVHVTMEKDYSIDWDKVKSVCNSKTKLLVINNPHNPSGKVFSTSDFSEIKEIMNLYPELILVSDEVYEFIHFEEKHISVNAMEELKERSIVVSSFGKTFHVTGWKIGYMVAPEKYMVELRKVHQYLVFCVNSVAQHTLSEFLPICDLSELGKFYQSKRDYFKNQLKDSKFKILDCQGSYFQTLDYSNLSDKSDVEFSEWLTKEVGVATIPVSVFNKDGADHKHIRVCFAKQEDSLKAAGELLCKI